MKFFIVKSGVDVVGKQAFGGQDASIDSLVAQFTQSHPTLTIVESDEATFDSTPLTINPVLTRAEALEALLTGATGQDKLTRAILLVILDEVNVIRNAISLTPRTANQFKSAVQAKLNTGAAD